MPWKEPGRGKNGNGDGGGDPWKGGGNGQQPPDLDEVFANVQRRLKGIMGGGKDSGGKSSGGGGGPAMGGIIGILVVVALLWAVWNAIHIIDEPERGVVLRFGEHVRTLDPGLNFTLPRPIEQVEKVDVMQVRSLQSRSRILTGDENLIEITLAVQFRASEPEKFLFNVQNPVFSLEHATDSAIREVVGINDMHYIMEEGREHVARAARILLQDIIDRYDPGISITSFNLQDVQPPAQVRDAFDDVVRAREDQIRFTNEAQAYANQMIPEARGRAARIREQAEGYKASVIERATGEAERFISVYTEYELAPEVTRKRLYLEAIEGVFRQTPKVMLDAQSGNNLFYLPLDRMGTGGTAAPPPPLLTPDSGRQTTTQNDPRDRRGREAR